MAKLETRLTYLTLACSALMLRCGGDAREFQDPATGGTAGTAGKGGGGAAGSGGAAGAAGAAGSPGAAGAAGSPAAGGAAGSAAGGSAGAGGDCEPGAKRCTSGVPESCDATGQWTAGSACTSGTLCDAGECVSCLVASKRPGGLDPEFSGGYTAFPLATSAPYDFETIALDSKGRIYVIGRKKHCIAAVSEFDIAIMRLLEDGGLDTSFNPDNPEHYLCVGGEGDDSVLAAFVDTSDRLVFAGHSHHRDVSQSKALIGRLDAQGRLDTSFAGGIGVALFKPEPSTNAPWTAYGVTQDGTDYVVSGGNNHPYTASTAGWAFRVPSNGFPAVTDTSFIKSGISGYRGGHVQRGSAFYLPATKGSQWTLDRVTGPNALSVAAERLASVTGATSLTLPQGIVPLDGGPYEFAVAGAVGTNPSAGAVLLWNVTNPATKEVRLPGFRWDPAYNRGPIARQCDGKVLVGAATTTTPQRPVIARIDPVAGDLDSTYGTAGTATLTITGDPKTSGVALAVRPDGRLVVGAHASLSGAWIHQLEP
jgi:hypothetical protein